MKVVGLSVLLCAETALAVATGSIPGLEKRQILPPALLNAMKAGDTSILGALGSKSFLE
jgi:hypothetical protein